MGSSGSLLMVCSQKRVVLSRFKTFMGASWSLLII